MSAPTVGAGLAAAPTVDDALGGAARRGVDRLDARLLLARTLGRPRTWLLAHGDAPLDAGAAARYAALVERRAAGEPVAYLIGEKEFHGLAFEIDPSVLVPRPETELLVDWALELLGAALAGVARPAVVDLGTGSGAIAVAVKHRVPRVAMTAVDTSAAALGVARRNAARWRAGVDFVEGAWWEPLGTRRYDLVLSNPPYVAAGDPHLAALRHEPSGALVGGADGLADVRAIVAGAADHLAPGGWIALEHGHDQADAVVSMLRAAGFDAVQTRVDLGGRPRCSGGRLRRVVGDGVPVDRE